MLFSKRERRPCTRAYATYFKGDTLEEHGHKTRYGESIRPWQLEFFKANITQVWFATSWADLIMQCVSQFEFVVLFSVLHEETSFYSRGLRCGDFLSRFLFILVVEVLSRGIAKEFPEGGIFLFLYP